MAAMCGLPCGRGVSKRNGAAARAAPGELEVSSALVVGLERKPDILGDAAPVEEEEQVLLRRGLRLLQGGRGVLRRGDRLVVDRHDDVARLDAELGRLAVLLDAGDDDALHLGLEAQPLARLVVELAELEPERAGLLR